jgi:hypothetical protein
LVFFHLPALLTPPAGQYNAGEGVNSGSVPSYAVQRSFLSVLQENEGFD